MNNQFKKSNTKEINKCEQIITSQIIKLNNLKKQIKHNKITEYQNKIVNIKNEIKILEKLTTDINSMIKESEILQLENIQQEQNWNQIIFQEKNKKENDLLQKFETLTIQTSEQILSLNGSS